MNHWNCADQFCSRVGNSCSRNGLKKINWSVQKNWEI